MNPNRSLPLAAGVIGTLAIAVLCALTLSAVKASDGTGSSYEASFS